MDAKRGISAFAQELLAFLTDPWLHGQPFDPGPGQQRSPVSLLDDTLPFFVQHMNLDANQLRKGDRDRGEDGRMALLHTSIVECSNCIRTARFAYVFYTVPMLRNCMVQMLVPAGTSERQTMQKITPEAHADVIARCLEAYLRAGTMELSLDQLGAETGTTKRMLVHYFGNRQEIEGRSMALFEERLKARFQADRFSPADTLDRAVLLLWESLVDPAFRSSLRLLLDLSRLAPKQDRARQFRQGQLALWAAALTRHTADRELVDSLLQLLEGVLLAFLVATDEARGRAALQRLAAT